MCVFWRDQEQCGVWRVCLAGTDTAQDGDWCTSCCSLKMRMETPYQWVLKIKRTDDLVSKPSSSKRYLYPPSPGVAIMTPEGRMPCSLPTTLYWPLTPEMESQKNQWGIVYTRPCLTQILKRSQNFMHEESSQLDVNSESLEAQGR